MKTKTFARAEVPMSPSLALVAACGVIGLLAIAGYLYGVRTLYAFSLFSSMAVHTAFLFVVISIGILCARPDRGPLGILTAEGIGSTMARRILPLAIVAPFAIGWLLVQAERQGSYGVEFSLALFATSTGILFALLVWITALPLNIGHAEQLQTEQSLLASESRLRTVLDSALSAVIVVDTTGRITDWNTRPEEMFGWTRDQSIGQELAERIIPPRYREAHRRALDRFRATGEGPALNRVIELTALRRDGTEFPVELFISSMDSDNTLAFCGFVTDISERKRAEEALRDSEEMLRATFSQAGVGIAVTSLDSHYLQVNDKYCAILGYTRNEMLHMSIRDVNRPDDIATYLQHRRPASLRLPDPVTERHHGRRPAAAVILPHGPGRRAHDGGLGFPVGVVCPRGIRPRDRHAGAGRALLRGLDRGGHDPVAPGARVVRTAAGAPPRSRWPPPAPRSPASPPARTRSRSSSRSARR